MNRPEIETLVVPLGPPGGKPPAPPLELTPRNDPPARAAPPRTLPDAEPCPLWQFLAIGAGFAAGAIGALGLVGYLLGAWQ